MILVLLLSLIAPSTAEAALDGWQWPLVGPVVNPFIAAAAPFAAGAHRGIDIAAPRGSTVRAACRGRVRFAGVAGRSGRTVSLRCGRFVTTYLNLLSSSVREGDVVRAGEVLGRVGAPGVPARARSPAAAPRDRGGSRSPAAASRDRGGSRSPAAAPHLHFGVRVADDRFGYVDPLTILPPRGGRETLPPLGPAPQGGGRPTAPMRGPLPHRPAPRVAPASPSGTPLAAWVALALLAVALPGGTVALGRRERTRTRGAAIRER